MAQTCRTISRAPLGPGDLFAPGEIERAFAAWDVLVSRAGESLEGDGTVRRFETLVARKR